MAVPQPSAFQVSGNTSPCKPYKTLSVNYGLPYTCYDLYTRLLDPRFTADILTHDFGSLDIEPRGPPNGPRDPFFFPLLKALSGHEAISTLFLTKMNWYDLTSRNLWYSSITAFSNITCLAMWDTSLQVDEFCFLIRSFPLEALEVHDCLITGNFPVSPLMDVETIRLNQQGPEIDQLIVTVDQGPNVLDIFTAPWSPVSFSKLRNLTISARSRNVRHQIDKLIEISIPLNLDLLTLVNFIQSPKMVRDL